MPHFRIHWPAIARFLVVTSVALQACSSPTDVTTPFVSVSIKTMVTGSHTCALTTTGAAYCWGYNATGELGNNDTALITSKPVAVYGGLTFESLAVSKVVGATCGVTVDGTAYCWGDNDQGELGDGTTTRRLIPTATAGTQKFTSLAMGSSHTCGLDASGTAYCWGTTANGAFGDGTIGLHLTPTATAPGMKFENIVAGSDFTCALTTAGAAYCWGLGFFGQLGNGAATSSTTPVPVSGGLTFRSLAAGGLAACGLTTDGAVYCWGQNFYGTLGDGTSGLDGGPGRRLAPVQVAGGLTFRSIAAGYETMCGVSDSGAGYCWGYNYGAIGDGTGDHRARPTAVAGSLRFTAISTGTGQSCGLTAVALYCWGDNSNGELGDGTIAPSERPTLVRWP